jgi:hypothetical protein
MNRTLVWYVGLPLALLLAAGGVVVGYYAYLLRGQAATRERLFSTPTGGKPHYDPIQYRAKDSRPAITEPEFAAAAAAKMAGGTKGIGVVVAGDARFYPLYVMQYHQVVNDDVGDKPIACSY